MNRKSQFAFLALAAATVVTPWLILLVGRGSFVLSVFWLLALTLLGVSIVMLRRGQTLATVGFIALVLTLFSMLIVPSLARAH